MEFKLELGDEIEFTWELEYYARQRITLTKDNIDQAVDLIEDRAWGDRLDRGRISLNDCNVVAVMKIVCRKGEVIHEGDWD